MENGKLPLGICKQAALKLDSFLTDIAEIEEDDDLDADIKNQFHVIRECANMILSSLLCIVQEEMDEDEFTREDVVMDDIEDHYNPTGDLGDQPIE